MRTHSPFVGALYFSKSALKSFQNLPIELPSKPDMPWLPPGPSARTLPDSGKPPFPPKRINWEIPNSDGTCSEDTASALNFSDIAVAIAARDKFDLRHVEYVLIFGERPSSYDVAVPLQLAEPFNKPTIGDRTE